MVNAKSTFINGEKQDSASNSEDLNEDKSLLRQPLRTSCAGFKEAKRAYENGTDEVRMLLMQECSLIYECNVCRNMFRSLTNFITHKRHYCTTATADNFYSFLGRNGSMVIQTDERSGPFLVKRRSTGSFPISNNKSPNRDLNKVIEQLKRVEVSSGCSRKKCTCNTELCLPEGNVADPILELERVSSTTNAVYQTLKTKNNVDIIETELDNEHKQICLELSNNTNVANEIDLGVTTENQTSNQVLEHNNKNDKMQNNQKEEEPEVKENETFGNGLHTVCLENIEILEEQKEENGEEQEDTKKQDNKSHCYADQTNDNKAEENDATSIDKSSKKEKSKRFRKVSASKQLTCRCKICNKQFNALSNLRRHILMFHYRSKRFDCNLCDYRVFRRYDIFNHLTFVHKITGERETMAVEYVTVHEIKYSKDDVEGDIVVVNDEAIVSELCRRKQKEPQTTVSEIAINRCEKREESKSVHMQPSTDALRALKINLGELKDKTHIKVVGRRFKKALETQAEDKKRPIRNRISTINQDFVYDLLPIKDEPRQPSKPQTTVSEIAINRCEKREESKSVHMQPSTDVLQPLKTNLGELKDKTHIKVVGRRFKKALETQAEYKKRPIRNRISTINQDFVYDLLPIKEEPKQSCKRPRLSCKRSNAAFIDQNNFRELDLAPPSVKITPYSLRTEPLIPADKSSVKGMAANVCRNVIHEGLAAPSTIPELPAERPQMRFRFPLSSRSDSNTIID